MAGERKSVPTLIRLVAILASLLVAGLFWAAYSNHVSSGGTDKAVTAARSSTLSSVSQETAHVSSGSEALSNAQSAIMFSVVPLQSLSVMMPSVDSDPVASFRRLIAPPPDTTREAPRIVDRGVVAYASGKTDGE